MSLEWLRSLGPKSKFAIIVCGSFIIGASTYGGFIYYQWRKSTFADEGFVEAIRVTKMSILWSKLNHILPDELPDRRVLVLGLEGSGKSSFLAQLPNVKLSDINRSFEILEKNRGRYPSPTGAFDIVSVRCSQQQDCTLNFWEIGHKKNMRTYWSNYFQDIDLVIFCVDSANVDSLPKAYDEFHAVQADERLQGVPILILATKQDKMGALGLEEIETTLDISNIPVNTHKIKALSITIYPKGAEKECLKNALRVIRSLCLINH